MYFWKLAVLSTLYKWFLVYHNELAMCKIQVIDLNINLIIFFVQE